MQYHYRRGHYLEQLYSDNGKHELQEVGDQHDIADGLNGNYHAFHYILVTSRYA